MNSRFNVTDTEFVGVKIITPFYQEDHRGYFLKSFEQDIFGQFGLDADIFEDFETYSTNDVIRGMHFQTKYPQTKLVRAVAGSIWDVIVDLRSDSETFGKWMSFELTDKNHKCLWIPGGFAHGFKVVSEVAIVSYKCLGKYLVDYDDGIRWNDPNLAINWQVENPIISERDQNLQSFSEYLGKQQSINAGSSVQ